MLDTPCTLTTFAGLRDLLEAHRRGGSGPLAVDFTNVHIVTARRPGRLSRADRGHASFIPDSRVLLRAVRWLGGPAAECLLGPH